MSRDFFELLGIFGVFSAVFFAAAANRRGVIGTMPKSSWHILYILPMSPRVVHPARKSPQREGGVSSLSLRGKAS